MNAERLRRLGLDPDTATDFEILEQVEKIKAESEKERQNKPIAPWCAALLVATARTKKEGENSAISAVSAHSTAVTPAGSSVPGKGQPTTVANVKNSKSVILNSEENPVHVGLVSIKQLPHLERKHLIFRCERTAARGLV